MPRAKALIVGLSWLFKALRCVSSNFDCAAKYDNSGRCDVLSGKTSGMAGFASWVFSSTSCPMNSPNIRAYERREARRLPSCCSARTCSTATASKSDWLATPPFNMASTVLRLNCKSFCKSFTCLSCSSSIRMPKYSWSTRWLMSYKRTFNWFSSTSACALASCLRAAIPPPS